jgi:hypothetical protein
MSIRLIYTCDWCGVEAQSTDPVKGDFPPGWDEPLRGTESAICDTCRSAEADALAECRRTRKLRREKTP